VVPDETTTSLQMLLRGIRLRRRKPSEILHSVTKPPFPHVPVHGRARLVFRRFRTVQGSHASSPDCQNNAFGSAFLPCYAQNIWLISRVFVTHLVHNFAVFSILEEVFIVNSSILSTSRNASIDAYKL
jgi:hypothetical protein